RCCPGVACARSRRPVLGGASLEAVAVRDVVVVHAAADDGGVEGVLLQVGAHHHFHVEGGAAGAGAPVGDRGDVGHVVAAGAVGRADAVPASADVGLRGGGIRVEYARVGLREVGQRVVVDDVGHLAHCEGGVVAAVAERAVEHVLEVDVDPAERGARIVERVVDRLVVEGVADGDVQGEVEVGRRIVVGAVHRVVGVVVAGIGDRVVIVGVVGRVVGVVVVGVVGRVVRLVVERIRQRDVQRRGGVVVGIVRRVVGVVVARVV